MAIAGRLFNKREILEATLNQVNLVKMEIAKKVLSVVVLSTPVGMPGTWLSPPPPGYQPGHARFSWRTSLRIPITTEVPGLDPGGTATISEGFSIIARSKLPEQIFFSNNAPYIGRLDEGHSRQAGANFVEKAVRLGVSRVGGSNIEVP